MSDKPLPPVDAESRAYWEACNTGRLLLQRCAACASVQFYPRVLCAQCGAASPEPVDASGHGIIRTFTIIRRAVSAAFDADVPYVVALIELAEGPTMMSNIIDSPLEAVAIGAPVQLTFERRSDAINIPQFRLVP
ncbi:MAG: Zn-ribbon domain-containing OB-fold protein [Pseudomonadales bacterium]